MLAVVLTVVEQVASNVSELQTFQDILHMMVSDQAQEQSAGLYRYRESVLGQLWGLSVPVIILVQ